jgi:hypothetical protein
MHDIEGYGARIDLELDKKGSGKFSFFLTGDHCSEEARTGEVQAKLGKDGSVTMLVRGGDVAPMAFTGRIHAVKVHAEAAITGTFTDPDPKAGRGGVAIFWRYASRR